ncbi:MAG: NAD-dependent epimerase/dehydratase family protein [Sphingobacteriaceae bacterium]
MILVTGATGFLGSVLTQQLLDKGLRVRALKRESSRIPTFLQDKPNLEWVNGEMGDLFSLEEALQGIKQVYHTAAIISFQSADRQKMIDTNVEGTANLINLCLDLPGIRLVHVSSVAALGDPKPGQTTNELDFLDLGTKPGGYATAKHLSEMEVWRGVAEGLDAVIVNPAIIIGKECGWKGSGVLFSTVERGLKYYPAGSCGLIAVEDVATAMTTLMNSSISGERYILNAETWLYKDLFQEISRGFGIKGPQKALSNWQLNWAAIAAEILAKIKAKPAALTRDAARSAGKLSNYSNQKIQQAIDIQFTPIRQKIAEICAHLK